MVSLTQHGKFGEGFLAFLVCGRGWEGSNTESPLPSKLEEIQLGLAWNLALGQGQFYNKKENRFLRFLPFPAISGIASRGAEF